MAATQFGFLGDLFKTRAEKQKREEESRLYNEFLGQRGSAVQDLLSKLSAGGWNPFGVNTLGSTQFGTTATDQMQRQRAVTAPEQLAMEQATRSLIEGRLGAPSAVSEGEKLRQVANIQKAHEGARTAAGNVAAARGFGGAQTYAGAAPTETAAASQIADYMASIPETERARRAEDIGLSEAFQTARRGQDVRTTGTTSMTGGGTQQVAPQMMDLASLLLPIGPKAGTKSGISLWGQGLSGLDDLSSSIMKMLAGGAGGGMG